MKNAEKKLGGVLIGLLFAPMAAAAESVSLDGIEINDRVEHYEITGDESRQLYMQMQELGPRDPATNQPRQGFAKWNVAWRYSTNAARGRCRLGDVEVSLDVLITLPAWQPASRATPELVAAWPEYLARLMEHERGHRAIGVAAAAQVRDALRAIPPGRDCSKLMGDADLAAEEAMRRFALADADYDRETDHGAKQGVHLP